ARWSFERALQPQLWFLSHYLFKYELFISGQFSRRITISAVPARIRRTMARKPKAKRRIYIPSVPQRTCWIESDSYDRRAWSDICADAPPISELVATGEALVPHFAA